MPDTVYNVLINLAGSVNPTVNLSFNRVIQQLRTINTQVTAVTNNIANMNRRMSAGGGMRGVGGLGGALLGGLAGFFAIDKLMAGMNSAIKLSQQKEQTEEATLVILMNQRALRHESLQLAAKDLKMLDAQASKLQEQTGIYQQVFKQGSMILAQTHRTPAEIQRINESMANLVAFQRMQGKSVESLPEIYQAVGKAIETGMSRNLNAVGVVLTGLQKTMLTAYARSHDYAKAMALVLGIIDRTYGGMSAVRMKTLTGQAELGIAKVTEAISNMGDALKPIKQQLQIIWGEIFPLIAPVVIRLANYINNALKNHMKDIKEWTEYVRKNVIPVIITLIDRGWKALANAIKFYNEQMGWAKPFVNWFIVALGAMLVAVVAVTAATWAWNFALYANPFGIWLLIIPAVIGALALLIVNFDSVKKAATSMWEKIVGTKGMDPKNQGLQTKLGTAVRRGFKPGEVPRAQPVELGLAQWYKTSFGPQLGETSRQWEGMADAWLVSSGKKMLAWITGTTKGMTVAVVKWYKDQNTGFGVWLAAIGAKWEDKAKNFFVKSFEGAMESIKNAGMGVIQWIQGQISGFWAWLTGLGQKWEKKITTWFTKTFDPVITGIKNIGQTILDWVLNPINAVNKAWQDFLQHLPFGGGTGSQNISTGAKGIIPLKKGAPGTGDIYNPATSPIVAAKPGVGGVVWVPGSKTWSFGIGERGVHAANYSEYGSGPLDPSGSGKRLLLENDIALSRDQLSKWGGPFRMGQYVNLIDPVTGRVVYAHQKIADVSSWSKEIAAKHGGQQPYRSLEQRHTTKDIPAGLGVQAEKSVTINYTVHHHHNGGDNLESRLATIHQRHIDQMTKDLAEVNYRDNRSRLDAGSRAT